MPTLANSNTTDRILDAAEELIAQHGFDGASFRNITRKAKVNLAAAHYHLGDKEALYGLVLTRRLQPLNATRLARLEQAEQLADGQPVPLARIIEILARPLFELSTDTTGGGRHFARILGRSLTEPLPFMTELFAREYQPVITRFGQALRRHVPNLAPEDFLWRLSFVLGAMHHTLATLHRMKELTRGICRDHDHAGALQRFIPFAVAVFLRPPQEDTRAATLQPVNPSAASGPG